MPRNKKLALNLGIKTYKILTNDDGVCIPSLSSILTMNWNYESHSENNNSLSGNTASVSFGILVAKRAYLKDSAHIFWMSMDQNYYKIVLHFSMNIIRLVHGHNCWKNYHREIVR